MPPAKKLRTFPLTPRRWSDLVKLFGPKGACAGCWCMYHRLAAKEWSDGQGATNRRRLKRLVEDGRVPGILGYLGRDPIAWCSVEPRENLPRLARSRVMKPVDDLPVWSIDCLFIHKDHRRVGRSVAMIEAAVAHAKKNGAELVEAYPIDPGDARLPAAFAYYGLVSAYESAGFEVVERRSPTRFVVRRPTA